jgi:hypothetical protein
MWWFSGISFVGSRCGRTNIATIADLEPVLRPGRLLPQRLQIIGNEAGKKLSVQIEGVETSVDKDKFSPVPSDRTWVCYARPGGTISNENIRCILYPQQSGTT